VENGKIDYVDKRWINGIKLDVSTHEPVDKPVDTVDKSGITRGLFIRGNL
jgi:hypothetical protein